MNPHAPTETLAFTARDEAWFAAGLQRRSTQKETAPPASVHLGDPIADSWFRSSRPRLRAPR